jgi:PTH1 family peptidyl-tRNA hydrolase
MKAIVGLGNPGPRYRNTRHNVGWQVLDELVRRWEPGQVKPQAARHAEVVKSAHVGQVVVLIKPQTFMNDSGKAVRALVEKDGLDPEDILVVYDDLDLAAGRIRVRGGGSSGGHRGIQSIQQHLAAVPRLKRRPAPVESEAPEAPAVTGKRNQPSGQPSGQPSAPAFPRIKVGIGRPPAGMDPIDFVLTTFAPDELTLIRPAIERAADAVECWIADGTDVAANRFNGM